MDFPDAVEPREPMPERIMSEATMTKDRAYADDVTPVAVAQAAERVSADVISLESMRSSMVTNFEPDDLDVPAFLRKRNDVM
jgi:hypothetical protein